MVNHERSLALAGESLSLPSFFPAVSSVKDDLQLDDYARVFNALGVQCGLISAYDWARANREVRTAAATELEQWRANGGLLLLDSGRYEAFWLRDGTWDHGAYVDAVARVAPTMALSFDEPSGQDESERQATEAIEAWTRDQEALPDTSILPVVHGFFETLPEAVGSVAEQIRPSLIAVAERELGVGLTKRAMTVHEIRTRLDEKSPETALHLLGAGSPVSVLVYAVAGASTFDGLEWNRTVVDRDTARLHHFQHLDFFEHQSDLPDSIPFRVRGLTHNLLFWNDWIHRLRDRSLRDVAVEYIPAAGMSKLRVALPELFS